MKTLQAHTRGGAIQLSREGSIEDSLYVLLGKLRNDNTLLNVLESKGAVTSFQQAQIHLLGDRLGELWIHLSHRPEQCVCRFEVESEAIVEAINDVVNELQGSLETQGFQRVHVEASLRSKDRMEALAGVLQRFSGLDVQI